MPSVIALDAMGADRAPKPEIEGAILAARQYGLRVLLALPLKVTCHEDCRGLCVHCGKNLNEEQCSCTTAIEDPRWTALREIRSKLEH